MGIIELFLIAVGLSMDAFAVSVCKGLAMKKCTWTKAGIVGLYFGIFQAGMPLLGYALGVQFSHVITSIDHWIAFVLLGIIGLNMIKESREDGEECEMEEDSLKVKEMLVLAVATSIDALAVGITFAFLQVDIIPAVAFIIADFILHFLIINNIANHDFILVSSNSIDFHVFISSIDCTRIKICSHRISCAKF